jgi:hypothetical protein
MSANAAMEPVEANRAELRSAVAAARSRVSFPSGKRHAAEADYDALAIRPHDFGRVDRQASAPSGATDRWRPRSPDDRRPVDGARVQPTLGGGQGCAQVGLECIAERSGAVVPVGAGIAGSEAGDHGGAPSSGGGQFGADCADIRPGLAVGAGLTCQVMVIVAGDSDRQIGEPRGRRWQPRAGCRHGTRLPPAGRSLHGASRRSHSPRRSAAAVPDRLRR